MQDYTVDATLSHCGDNCTKAVWHRSFSGVRGDIDPQVMIELMTSTYDAMLAEMEKAASA